MRKFALITFIIVAFFIAIITVILFNSNVNQTVRKKVASKFAKSFSIKSSYNCRKSRHHDRIRWNYFYYYQNKKNRKSLLWCKIPKAGSTTLTKLFLHLAGANHILKRNTTKLHKTLRTFYPRPSLKNVTKHLKASYKFIIVRHPFERILSAYRDKLESYSRDLRFRNGYYYNHYGRLMKSVNSTRKEPTWQEFIAYLIRTPIGRFDEHWMPMTRLCSPCSLHYDAIIKLENFSAEVTKMFKNIGMTVSRSVVGFTHRTGSSNMGTVTKYFEKLHLKDLKQLYRKYRNDFVVFGYKPFKYYKMSKS